MILLNEERVTFTLRYPITSMYWLPEATFKVHEYKDHLEIWRSDSRGRWRRRKTMPKELTSSYKTFRSYDLMAIPHVTDGVPPRVVGRADCGEVRDPAFMPREPNPTVAIRTEGGGVIWRDGDDPAGWDLANHVAGVFDVPLDLIRPGTPL